MRVIKSIEMANDGDVYDVRMGGVLTVAVSDDGDGCDIIEDGRAVDWAQTSSQAEAIVMARSIDDDLIVSGHGVNSGRKFWQLPEMIKREVVAMATRGE